jgi:hypothetical protein
METGKRPQTKEQKQVITRLKNKVKQQDEIIARQAEDILPMKEWFKALKQTIKEIIVTVYCPRCKKRISKKPIPKQRAMTGSGGPETIFKFGENRGRGNIKELQGENYQGIMVSDDYGAYKNSFKEGKHALCWAHPFRKFKLLAKSKNLSKKTRKHCQGEYIIFAKLSGGRTNKTSFKLTKKP